MLDAKNEFINQTLEVWATDFMEGRRARLQRAKVDASGDLINSLDTDIQKARGEQAAQVFFLFNDYGRFLDLRKRDRRKQIPVDEIKEWIKDKGISSFRKKVRDRNGTPLSGNRLINAIAWGIARKKKKTKRVNWWNKAKTAAIFDLYDQLAIGLTNIALEEAKKCAQNGNT